MLKNSSEHLGNHTALHKNFTTKNENYNNNYKFDNYFHSMKIGKSTPQLHDNHNAAEEQSHWHYFQNVFFVFFYQLMNDNTLTANQNQQLQRAWAFKGTEDTTAACVCNEQNVIVCCVNANCRSEVALKG